MLIRSKPNSEPGACLINALYEFGFYDPRIPEWTLIDDVGKICAMFGLTFYGPGSKNVTIKDEPVIIIYKHGELGHAVLTKTPRDFIGKVKLIGIITK